MLRRPIETTGVIPKVIWSGTIASYLSLRLVVRRGVAVEKLAHSEFAKIESRQEALQTIFPVSWTFSITRFSTFSRKTEFFNISNEVGRVKRDLIFFLVRA